MRTSIRKHAMHFFIGQHRMNHKFNKLSLSGRGYQLWPPRQLSVPKRSYYYKLRLELYRAIEDGKSVSDYMSVATNSCCTCMSKECHGLKYLQPGTCTKIAALEGLLTSVMTMAVHAVLLRWQFNTTYPQLCRARSLTPQSGSGAAEQ